MAGACEAMAEYLSPGVYVEEFSSGIKPMEGVSTSTAGFIGMAQRGPVRGVPEFISSFGEYQRIFGGYLPKKEYKDRRFLPMAVEQFFANGGSRCFIVRLLNETEAALAAVQVGDVTFQAANPGAWGNSVTLHCKPNPVNDKLFSLQITTGSGADDYAESYQDLCLAPGKENSLVQVLEKSLLVRADYAGTGENANLYAMFPQPPAAPAANDTPTDNTEAATPAALKAQARLKQLEHLAAAAKDIAALAQEKVNAAKKAMDGAWDAAKTDADDAAAKKTALDSADDAGKADAQTAYLAAREKAAASQAAFEEAQKTWKELDALAVQDAQESARATAVYAAAQTGEPAQPVPETTPGAWLSVKLAGGADCLEGTCPADQCNADLLGGNDGGAGNRTGLCAFEDIPEISILAAPGVTEPAEVQKILVHCDKMQNRVCILDMPADLNKVTALQEYRKTVTSSYAAMYHPWLQVYDALEKRAGYMPPSGAMAGVYARSDNTRGVHKAPANEVIRNCTGLKTLFGKAEQDMLNPIGINLIRNIQGLGIRVWGARTCSDDSSWKYINVRRLFIYIEETIRRNTAWAVFEPNDQLLWTKVRGTITSFLSTLWRDGALFGASEAEAYYVNIGKGSTMTDDDILNGRLICVIGVAPVRPAEFVVFRITQIMEQN